MYVTAYWQGGLGNQIYLVYAVLTYSFRYRRIPIFIDYPASNGHRPVYWNSLFKMIFRIDVDQATTRQWIQLYNEYFSESPYEYTELYGYFQDVRLFQEYKDTIYQLLHIADQKQECKDRLSNLFSSSQPNVAIHFRIGDYRVGTQQNLDRFGTSHPGMPILPESYYKEACTFIQPQSNVLVFCEPENHNEVESICRRVIKGSEFRIIDNLNEIDSLLCMSNCDQLIIANSSFSWWAAYWSNHSNVLCPYKWFEQFTDADRCCDGWNIILYEEDTA
jgi:hypothetical protein